jgi:hypothetical protein
VSGRFAWLLRRRQTACRRCPHGRDSHTSYIPGGDRPGYCSGCACYQYKPERAWSLMLAYLRHRPAPAPVPVVLRPRPVPFPVREPVAEDHRTRLDLHPARPYTAGQVGPYTPRRPQ